MQVKSSDYFDLFINFLKSGVIYVIESVCLITVDKEKVSWTRTHIWLKFLSHTFLLFVNNKNELFSFFLNIKHTHRMSHTCIQTEMLQWILFLFHNLSGTHTRCCKQSALFSPLPKNTDQVKVPVSRDEKQSKFSDSRGEEFGSKAQRKWQSGYS